MANFTYDNGAKRPSLLDLLTNISPKETQLSTGLQKSAAKDMVHLFPQDTLTAVTTNAARVEGADPGYADTTNPTTNLNYCQIVYADVKVTLSAKAQDTAGVNGNRFDYEVDKAMALYKNRQEFALLRSTLVCGTGSAARNLKGMKSWISTNATAQSGVSLSETIMAAYIGNAWDQGGNVDEIYVGKVLKQRISGFTAGATKMVDTTDKRLVNAVDVYESDFGICKLFKHRYMTISGDTNYDIMGIDSERWAIAYFREPQLIELAQTGSAQNATIEGELTVESRAEAASFIATKHY